MSLTHLKVSAEEVTAALAARPEWTEQWFEIDGETAFYLKPGDYFEGGIVREITAARWPISRLFVHVITEPPP